MLRQRILKYFLHYDPETGIWTRRRTTRYCVSGERADYRGSAGYHFVGFEGETFSAHRLAWFYMTGKWPSRQVDHEDTDGSNNRWRNLRLATPSQNACNKKIDARNTSGLKGVSWRPRAKKWTARITKDGQAYDFGYFDTFEEAAIVRFCAANLLHGEFARHA